MNDRLSNELIDALAQPTTTEELERLATEGWTLGIRESAARELAMRAAAKNAERSDAQPHCSTSPAARVARPIDPARRTLHDEEVLARDEVKIYVVDGCEGPSLAINDLRVAGPKPWGGGSVTRKWKSTRRAVLQSLGLEESRATEALTLDCRPAREVPAQQVREAVAVAITDTRLSGGRSLVEKLDCAGSTAAVNDVVSLIDAIAAAVVKVLGGAP